jgi:hypothetical protein
MMISEAVFGSPSTSIINRWSNESIRIQLLVDVWCDFALRQSKPIHMLRMNE